MKGRIRQMQQQMARQRMMQEVPKADVVVVNPTHFAVALKYDEKRMRAPIVVAKGVDVIAAKIREVAGEHAVPIFEAPPLARVLYRNVEIGDEIPSGLYVAVAQILTYVFQLRVAKRAGRSRCRRSRTSKFKSRGAGRRKRGKLSSCSKAAVAAALSFALFPLPAPITSIR